MYNFCCSSSIGPIHLTLSFKFYIGVQLINNVVLVSGVEQSDSVIHIHVSNLFQILLPFRFLQNIEQSSLCNTVSPCRLSILNTAVSTCQSQSPNLSLPPHTHLTLNAKAFSFSVAIPVLPNPQDSSKACTKYTSY